VKKIQDQPDKERLDEFKKDLNSNEINWADYVMADDSDSNEINLGDFDIDNDELVAKASARIKKENALPGLVYINTALSELGYETNNHYPFFFTSLVNVSDKELSGFLYVNRDGFHSNCIEESELQMIFSWDSVIDIELVEEDESSIRINIVSEEGKLTINEPYSKNMVVLLSIYKNIWKKVVKRFAGENVIMWDVIENEMGVNIYSFDTHEEYVNWINE
jgi:hypothetical protein